METASLDDLKAIQLKRLKWVVGHAYDNNEAYHKRFRDAGVGPDDIRCLDDVTKLPVLAKEDLRHAYPFGLICTPKDTWIELHSSSGTTGKPVTNVYTENDLQAWGEVMARGLYAGGLRPGDRMQIAYGFGLFTGGFGFYHGARKLGAFTVPTSSGNTKRQIRLMADFGAHALAATPSYGLYLAEAAQEMGMSPDDFELKVGFFGAEAWSEEIRNKIEEAWGPGFRAAEAFGLTEVGGPGTSFDCEERTGLHINMDHFLVECVDEDMNPVGEGEEGELIITTLTHEGFPAIRFRTKDLSMIFEDKCACGRTLVRHSRILGRRDDMMKIKGVIVFPRQIEEAILGVDGASGNYQLIKFQAGPFVDLSVNVEPTPERWGSGDHGSLAGLIAEEINNIVGLNLKVDIVEPGTIPRSEGKAKRVIDMTKG
jgi:phenylacetate-CoA ligase